MATLTQNPTAPPAYLPSSSDNEPITKASTTTPSNDPSAVKTTINYFQPAADGSPPPPTYIDRPETYDRPEQPREVFVHDARGREKDFSLDGNGFEFFERPSKVKDFSDEEAIKSEYYAEVEQLLKDATGASRIFIFDHTIRRPPPPISETSDPAAVFAAAIRGPVNRVHIDQSYAAALRRVPYHLPEEAERLTKSRVQIINVWRPIKTIRRSPLAVADAHSVDEKDLVPVKLIYPDREGETLSVTYNEAHRWYFKSELSPDEAILIKCFDSKLDGRARRSPHTAFEIPGTEDWEGRVSIEIRALVFHEDQSLE